MNFNIYYMVNKSVHDTIGECHNICLTRKHCSLCIPVVSLTCYTACHICSWNHAYHAGQLQCPGSQSGLTVPLFSTAVLFPSLSYCDPWLVLNESINKIPVFTSSVAPITSSVNCTNGALRLRGGTTSREGRVEICYEHQWGTVCDALWGSNDAKVACRQLGFSSSGN